MSKIYEIEFQCPDSDCDESWTEDHAAYVDKSQCECGMAVESSRTVSTDRESK